MLFLKAVTLAGAVALAMIPPLSKANTFSATGPNGEELTLQQLIQRADTSISDVIHLPIQGLSAVENDEGTIMFVSDNGRFAIVGELVDVWQAKTLNSMTDIQDAIEKVNLREHGIEIERLNVVSVGTGPKEVVVFVDPNCDTCTQVMADAEALADQYTFRFLVVPAFGDQSNELAKQLFCSKSSPDERYQALKTGTIASLERKAKCPLDYYDQTLLIAHLLSVDGVPYIMSPDDQVFRGRPANLGRWLSGNKE